MKLKIQVRQLTSTTVIFEAVVCDSLGIMCQNYYLPILSNTIHIGTYINDCSKGNSNSTL